MKLKFWFVILILVSLILVIEYDISRRTQARAIASRGISGVNLIRAPTFDATKPTVTAADETHREPQSFESRFKSEVTEMSRLQSDPAAIEGRLELMAQSLTEENISSLQKIIKDAARNGDDRALSIEILSRKRTPQALNVLESFVKDHQTTTKANWSRPQEFDSVMTAQAIEGIAAYPDKGKALTSLDALSKTVDESFLLDRIARSKQSISGNAPSTEIVDDGALKKLIE